MASIDRELALCVARGDPDAFGELIHVYQAEVFNAALRMLGNRQDAEDAAQETFLRAYRAIHSFDPQRPPGPWLKKIAVNVCLNRLERRGTLALEDEDLVSTQEPGPETRSLDGERRAEIRHALLSLPPRYRAAIELRHFQDLSYAEMAEALGRPMSFVKSDLFRARKLLAKRLKDMR
jgi:RNA polymerase sigma-70 factor (ECF subfamily)